MHKDGLDLTLDEVKGDEEAYEGLSRGRGRKDITTVIGCEERDVGEGV